jgi:hypothetical protein
MSGSYIKTELHRVLARLERVTGKRYARLSALLDNISDESLSHELVGELSRLVGDVEQEVAMAKRQGNRDAWQRGKVY